MKSRLSRRSFMLGAAGIAGLGAAASALPVRAEVATSDWGKSIWDGLPDIAKQIPRNQTMIMSVSDTENQIGDVGIENPFVTGQYRTGWNFAFEPLYFYNMWNTKAVSGPSWNPGKNGEIPYQATSYQYKSDFTGVTIKLRKGVEWSDGQAFTSKDVVFTINMLLAHTPTLVWSPQMTNWVQSVSAPDAETVEITFTKPTPRFMAAYMMWHADVGFPAVPEHIWNGQDPTSFTNSDISKGWPVVTGPWKLVETSTTQKIWQRRDDWWGAKTGFHRLPAMKQVIVLPLFVGSKLVQMLIDNDADTTHSLIPTDAQVAAQKNAKLILHSKKVGDWGWLDSDVNELAFNSSQAPWNDSRMRWAINYMVDRQQIVQVGFANQNQSVLLPPPPYAEMQQYINNAAPILKQYPVHVHNLNKSASLLRELGYTKDSSGFWSKDGNQLSMVIIAAAGLYDSYLPVIVAQLRKGGVNASYKTPTNEANLALEGEFDGLIQFNSNISTRDPYDVLSTYEGKYYKPTGVAATYAYRWRNSTYDQWVDKMSALPSPGTAFMNAWHKAMEQWVADLPSIPLARNYIICPANTTYWTGWPDEKNPYASTIMWHRGEGGLVLNTIEPAKKKNS